MRLAAKLILIYLLGLLLIVGVFTALTVSNQRRLAVEQQSRRAAELVASMRPSIAGALRRGGVDEVQRLLDSSSSQIRSLEMRYVRDGKRIFASTTIRSVVHDLDNGRVIVTQVPLSSRDPSLGTIEIVSGSAYSSETLRHALLQSGVALFSVTALSALVIGIGGIYWVGRPLRHLITRVDSIAEGDWNPREPLAARDELGRLSVAIESMCRSLASSRLRVEEETRRRLDTVDQLRRAERLGTVGRLAAGMAHEVGTPLAVVSGRAELIASGRLSQAQTRDNAGIIKREADRIADIVRQLLGFARGGGGDRRVFCLGELMREMRGLMTPIAEKSGVEVIVDDSDDDETPQRSSNRRCEVFADRSQVQQVVTNLISNAIDASATRIELTCRPDTDDRVVMTVHDNGDGMDDETREHLFEPFYTTKDVGRGTGLGLSIVYGILQEHGAAVEVSSRIGEGTEFVIRWPAAAQASEPSPSTDRAWA